MSIRWIPTSAKAYAALREFHDGEMYVHGTISEPGEERYRMMTEWGLKGADYPLIKRDDINAISHYYIAIITREEQT